MILTVLWEDERGGAIRGFMPHDLLLACLKDDTGGSIAQLKSKVLCSPKKGSAKVIGALEAELASLRDLGPVVAVIDRDKVRDLWAPESRPTDCITGIKAAVAAKAPGTYELVLLVQNVETLIDACCDVRGVPRPEGKPTPVERDRLIAPLVWNGIVEQRRQVRARVTSFDRLVVKVAGLL